MIGIFKNLNRKGFTLIELLAVVVILAVILVVTIPSVLDTMTASKEKAFEDASEIIRDYVQKNYDINLLDTYLNDSGIDFSENEIVLTEEQIQKAGYSSDSIKAIEFTVSNGKVEISCVTAGDNFVQSSKIDSCSETSIANYITKKLYSKTGTVTEGDGITVDDIDATHQLIKDPDGNIRYYGVNPNNYIYFNCDTYPNTNCETWRIIGVFNKQLKLIKKDSIGEINWDTDSKNDFANSSLKKILEGYYNGTNTTYGTIKENTRGKVSEHTYSLRSQSAESINSSMYPNDVLKMQSNGSVYVDNSLEYTGNISLLYIADYVYASDFNSCIGTIENYSSDICKETNYFYNDFVNFPFLNHDVGSYYLIFVFLNGGILSNSPSVPYNIYPVLYLNSNIVLADGDGSSSNPYKLSA